MNNKDVFAKNLRKQMELKGKSRNDICQALEISYFTVSDWVNGKKYPRMDKVEKMAAFFGIPKSELIEERRVVYIEESHSIDDENPHELRLLESFDKLDVDNQILVSQWVEDYSKDQQKETPDKLKLTEGEKLLLDLFNQVPEDKQQLVLQMIRAALGIPE